MQKKEKFRKNDSSSQIINSLGGNAMWAYQGRRNRGTIDPNQILVDQLTYLTLLLLAPHGFSDLLRPCVAISLTYI